MLFSYSSRNSSVCVWGGEDCHYFIEVPLTKTAWFGRTHPLQSVSNLHTVQNLKMPQLQLNRPKHFPVTDGSVIWEKQTSLFT